MPPSTRYSPPPDPSSPGSVYLPESAEQAIVYNVAGMRVAESRYHGTDMAQIDLSALPPGFYIALLRGESGRTYSLRLYR